MMAAARYVREPEYEYVPRCSMADNLLGVYSRRVSERYSEHSFRNAKGSEIRATILCG